MVTIKNPASKAKKTYILDLYLEVGKKKKALSPSRLSGSEAEDERDTLYVR